MGINYKNENGLNERKSNQGSQNIHLQSTEINKNSQRFNDKDQEKVENAAGSLGETSGDSFDKYPKDSLYNDEKKLTQNIDISKSAMNHESKKDIIQKDQQQRPRDNA